jgi:hypothetical protein
MDFAGSMLGWPDRRARGAFGCVGPVRPAGGFRRWTRLEEVLAVQLTKFSAVPRFGYARIGGSVARASSVTSFTSLRFVQRNHQRLLATERAGVLEVPFEVLSRTTGRPS